MSRTHKDKKEAKHKAILKKNGPSNFKILERRKRRAQDSQALREQKEPQSKHYYSVWYW